MKIGSLIAYDAFVARLVIRRSVEVALFVGISPKNESPVGIVFPTTTAKKRENIK